MPSFFRYLILILIIGSIISACRKDSTDLSSSKEYPGVDEALWLYFERFENEGERRGFEIDLIARGITAHIASIQQEHVGGLCNYFSDNANELVIDKQIWASISELQKELVLFHELGHCYLLREHREDAYDNGFCKSIMRSGTSDCDDNYLSSTRKLYLDELFDPDSVN